MKKIITLASLVLLIVSFQNCSQRNMSGDSSAGVASTAAGVAMLVTPTSNLTKVVLWNPDKQQYLDVNLGDGKMTAYEGFGQVRGEKYCLSASELGELTTILQNSSVCEPKVSADTPKGQVCTEIYKYPYMSLVQGSQEFRLGEMTNGCDNPTDLCGDNASALKNFSTAILKNIDTRLCN
jgi:hypothetical protein